MILIKKKSGVAGKKKNSKVVKWIKPDEFPEFKNG